MGSDEKPMDRRGWSECPTCGGTDRVERHPGSGMVYRVADLPDYPIMRCPACAAHFRQLDAELDSAVNVHLAAEDAAYERGVRECYAVIAEHGAIETELDGDSWCAHFGDFENLQVSPAAFGYTQAGAAIALIKQILHAGPAPTPEGKRCGKCAHDYENCGPAKYAPSKCARWTPKTVAKDGGK